MWFHVFTENARRDSVYAKKLTWVRRLHIAFDVACGMQYLHYRDCSPVLHRDLKSPNLLLDENLNCKICDFNTSRSMNCRMRYDCFCDKGARVVWIGLLMHKLSQILLRPTIRIGWPQKSCKEWSFHGPLMSILLEQFCGN